MAGMTSRHLLLFLMAAAVGSSLLTGAAAYRRNHIVGGSFGWKNPQNATFFSDWAKDRVFHVGDRLVFMYTTAVYNVMEVPEDDFNACTQKNKINIYYNGPTVLELTTPGPHYYYSGIALHCEGGQKLSINVLPLRTSEGPAAAPLEHAPTPSSSHDGRIPSAAASVLLGVSLYVFNALLR